jgi:shikimate dehydrogenase
VNVLGGTRILGVFGDPIAHSMSPVMHNAAIRALNIDYTYVPFHVTPENLESAVAGIRAMEIAGVNVTIPHKEAVIGYLDEVSRYSTQIRSVNTIVNVNGHLKGDTTDGPEFLRSAEAQWGRLNGCKTLILGAGGSAKAVAFALAEIGCEFVIANRTRERANELAGCLGQVFETGEFRVIGLDGQALSEGLSGVDLVVNTTSIGMHPDVDGIPMPPELLRPNLLVYDLVYNPARTRLVMEAEERGANAITGLKMLAYQGALSFEMWTGREAPVDVMEEAARQVLERWD